VNVIRTGLILGIVIWAAATAVFVPLGHFVFGPDNRIPAVASAALIVVATFYGIFALAKRVLAPLGPVTLERAALLGVLACLPGLIGDGTLYVVGAGRYPGLDGAASGSASATLLYAYAAALLGCLAASRSIARSR
jgi:hypothetical protein